MASSNRILVLGSSFTAKFLYSFVLQEHGFKVTFAQSIESGRACFDATDTDLIVLDWLLENATQALRQLRISAPSIPVIIVAPTIHLPKEVTESAFAVVPDFAMATSLLPVVRAALRLTSKPTPLPLKTVPLGIGDYHATMGKHFAMFWESEAELAATAKFFTVGLETGDHFVLAVPEATNGLMSRALKSNGVDIATLKYQGRLHVIETEVVDIAIPQAIEAIQSAVSRGAPVVRFLGHVAGRQTAVNEHAVIEGEAALDKVVCGCRCVCICPYHVNAINGGTMLKAGLRHHASVILNESILDNPFYVATRAG